MNNTVKIRKLITRLCLCVCLCLIGGEKIIAAEDAKDNSIQESMPATTETAAKNIKSTKPTNDTASCEIFIPPADNKYDWIQLTSGEWLKGELQGMYNYSLEFDSDELNLQEFDWNDIKQIRTAHNQSLRIIPDSGEGDPITAIGVLHLDGSKAKLTANGKEMVFNRREIVSIAVGSKKEIDLWSGNLSLGVNLTGGNSELINTNFTANTRRSTADSRIVIEFSGNYSKAQGVETSNNHRFNAYYDIYVSAKYFWRPIFGEYYRDTFKNINHQATAGTAVGYHITRTSKKEWDLTAGIGAIYKQYVSVEAGQDSENTSPSLGLGTRYESDITSWMTYLFGLSFQVVDKESGSLLYHLITTLTSDLISGMNLNVSFVWDHVQDPQPDADGTIPQQNDYQLILGIGYDF